MTNFSMDLVTAGSHKQSQSVFYMYSVLIHIAFFCAAGKYFKADRVAYCAFALLL